TFSETCEAHKMVLNFFSKLYIALIILLGTDGYHLSMRFDLCDFPFVRVPFWKERISSGIHLNLRKLQAVCKGQKFRVDRCPPRARDCMILRGVCGQECFDCRESVAVRDVPGL